MNLSYNINCHFYDFNARKKNQITSVVMPDKTERVDSRVDKYENTLSIKSIRTSQVWKVRLTFEKYSKINLKVIKIY